MTAAGGCAVLSPVAALSWPSRNATLPAPVGFDRAELG